MLRIIFLYNFFILCLFSYNVLLSLNIETAFVVNYNHILITHTLPIDINVKLKMQLIGQKVIFQSFKHFFGDFFLLNNTLKMLPWLKVSNNSFTTYKMGSLRIEYLNKCNTSSFKVLSYFVSKQYSLRLYAYISIKKYDFF